MYDIIENFVRGYFNPLLSFYFEKRKDISRTILQNNSSLPVFIKNILKRYSIYKFDEDEVEDLWDSVHFFIVSIFSFFFLILFFSELSYSTLLFIFGRWMGSYIYGFLSVRGYSASLYLILYNSLDFIKAYFQIWSYDSNGNIIFSSDFLWKSLYYYSEQIKISDKGTFENSIKSLEGEELRVCLRNWSQELNNNKYNFEFSNSWERIVPNWNIQNSSLNRSWFFSLEENKSYETLANNIGKIMGNGSEAPKNLTNRVSCKVDSWIATFSLENLPKSMEITQNFPEAFFKRQSYKTNDQLNWLKESNDTLLPTRFTTDNILPNDKPWIFNIKLGQRNDGSWIYRSFNFTDLQNWYYENILEPLGKWQNPKTTGLNKYIVVHAEQFYLDSLRPLYYNTSTSVIYLSDFISSMLNVNFLKDNWQVIFIITFLATYLLLNIIYFLSHQWFLPIYNILSNRLGTWKNKYIRLGWKGFLLHLQGEYKEYNELNFQPEEWEDESKYTDHWRWSGRKGNFSLPIYIQAFFVCVGTFAFWTFVFSSNWWSNFVWTGSNIYGLSSEYQFLKIFLDLNNELNNKLYTSFYTGEILFFILIIFFIFKSLSWRLQYSYRLLNFTLNFYIIIILFFLFCNIYFTPSFFVGNKLLFNSGLLINYFTSCSKLFIIALTLIFLLISLKFFFSKKNKYNDFVDYPLLIALSVFFILIIVSAFDLMIMYVAIEGLSILLYIIAMFPFKQSSIESSIKYYALGALSSGILLFGISLMYGSTGAFDFFNIKTYFIYKNFPAGLSFNFLMCLSFIFSFLFKLSAFPCHMWAPDVYEGTWLPTTVFFMTVVKMSIYLFFIRFLIFFFYFVSIFYQDILAISAIGSLIVGCFGSIYQHGLKRLLAYASISQVGFSLIGLFCNSFGGITSSLMFFTLYTIVSLGIFTILINSESFYNGDNMVFLSDLSNFSKCNTLVSTFLSIFLFSMAGIPPLSGFFSKLFVFIATMGSHYYVFTIGIIFLSVVNGFVYFRMVKILWSDSIKLVNIQKNSKSNEILVYDIFIMNLPIIWGVNNKSWLSNLYNIIILSILVFIVNFVTFFIFILSNYVFICNELASSLMYLVN